MEVMPLTKYNYFRHIKLGLNSEIYILSVKTPAPRKRSSFLGYENKEIPQRFCEINYVYISFSFQAKKQETNNQWSVSKEKGKMGSKPKVQSHSPGEMIIIKEEAWETFSNMMNAA